MPGTTLLEQLQTVQLVALAGLLPWTAARILIPERGRALAVCAAVVARRPSSIVLARIAATAAVLALIGLSGLPAIVLAQQMSAVPLARVASAFPALAAICIIAAATATGWALATRLRLVAWLGGAFSAVILLSLPRWSMGASDAYTVAILVGILLTLIVAASSDRVYSHAHT
jgi:hypothetical protein